MKRVHKSVLLWYSPREMYDLVTAFEQYPRFLPWCERVEVLQRADDYVLARMHMAFAGVRQAITTRNTNTPTHSVRLQLVDGPFSTFEGLWEFEPIGGQEQACRIEFELDYAFASTPLEAALAPVFDKVANTLVDRFVQRAEAVYGAR
jgi:ribosome-associated toxin RatA of RatAB toxin-antitoxin module